MQNLHSAALLLLSYSLGSFFSHSDDMELGTLHCGLFGDDLLFKSTFYLLTGQGCNVLNGMFRAAVLVLQSVNLHQLKASITSLLVLLTLQGITCQRKASIFQMMVNKNILVRHICTIFTYRSVL